MAGTDAPDPDELAREITFLREERLALGQVLKALAASRGLQAVLDEIIAAAARLCRAEHGQLYLADGEVFRVVADHGESQESFEFSLAHPVRADRSSIVGRTALAGDTVQIPDVLEDEEYTFGGQQIVGFRALVGVPILLEGTLIGAMSVGRNTPGRFDVEHVDLLRQFADQAAIAIANARLLDTVERQRTELARFLSPSVAELISSVEGEQLLAGHRGYLTCLFSDLRGFTSFAETAAPEELFEVLRPYHETIGELIREYGGTLEHFAGDGILIFFNDPVPMEDHELQAIRFALAAQDRFERLAALWRKRGANVGLGIGIEAGYATIGRIGFEGRYDYAVLGSVTILASRLSSTAEAGQILIGSRVFAAVDEDVETAPVGELELKGFGRPIPTYEVRGLRT